MRSNYHEIKEIVLMEHAASNPAAMRALDRYQKLKAAGESPCIYYSSRDSDYSVRERWQGAPR